MSGNAIRTAVLLGAAAAFGAGLILGAVLSWPEGPLTRGLVLGFLAGGFGASAFWLGAAVQAGSEPEGPNERAAGGVHSPHAVSPEEAKRLLQTFLATKKQDSR